MQQRNKIAHARIQSFCSNWSSRYLYAAHTFTVVGKIIANKMITYIDKSQLIVGSAYLVMPFV